MNYRSSEGVPSTLELLDAVSEWLTLELSPHLDRDLTHGVRICVAALAIVQRDIEHGPAVAAEVRKALADLGVDSQEALAQEIRAGQTPERRAHTRRAVAAMVAAELSLVTDQRNRGAQT